MKSKFLLIMFVLTFIVSIGIVESACTDISSLNNTDKPYNITSNITFCNVGTINATGYTYNYVFNISGSNYVIDCNGTTIIGNLTTSSKAFIRTGTNTNITIQNCNISGYYNAIDASFWVNGLIKNNYFGDTSNVNIILNGGRGTNIINNVITNTKATNVIFSNSGGNYNISNNTLTRDNYLQSLGYLISFTGTNVGYNSTISYNNLIKTDLISSSSANGYGNISIFNNNFTNRNAVNVSTGGIYLVTMANNTYPINIYNNIMTNTHSPIDIFNCENINIYNNVQYNLTKNTGAIAFININKYSAGQFSKNINVTNNTINLTDTGIVVQYNSSNIHIDKNTIDNTYTYTDAWGTGIRIEYNNTNISIINNRIINSAGAGIMIRKTNKVNISNNYIDALPMYSRNGLGAYLVSAEYSSGIALIELYLGFTGDSSESIADDISKISSYKNTNININNNTYGTNLQLLIVDQGTINLTKDISNYWLRTLNYNTLLMDDYKYYFQNHITQLQCEYSNYANKPGNQTKNWCAFAYPWNLGGLDSATHLNNYTIYSITPWLINISNRDNITLNTSVTEARAYYPYNDIKNTSNGIILVSNVDNYSLTLSSGQQIEITNYGYKVWAPNILYINDINSNNYWDRLVKNYYGGILRLPDNINQYQSSFIITPGAVNQTLNISIPLQYQINAYSDNYANKTAIVTSTLRVCYSSIYGGPITCLNTNQYNYTLV